MWIDSSKGIMCVYDDSKGKRGGMGEGPGVAMFGCVWVRDIINGDVILLIPVFPFPNYLST